jgi:hypothetical protein
MSDSQSQPHWWCDRLRYTVEGTPCFLAALSPQQWLEALPETSRAADGALISPLHHKIATVLEASIAPHLIPSVVRQTTRGYRECGLDTLAGKLPQALLHCRFQPSTRDLPCRNHTAFMCSHHRTATFIKEWTISYYKRSM